MEKTTACALDCYDACKIIIKDGSLSHLTGDSKHPAGNGALCKLINNSIQKENRILKPRVDGVEVSLDEVMKSVVNTFKNSKSLLWRGSGNMGVMQEVTDLFMEKIGAFLTRGSLCDGAGEAGILEGRGINKTLPLEQIDKADTIVVWGRNLTVTNSHMLPFLEGKKIVVIDPVKTPIAKKADMYLQIQPRSDYYLAIMLSRFLCMENSHNAKWLEEFASDYEEFYEFTQEHRIKAILAYIGIDLSQMGEILEYLRHKKVVFLVGTGVQKYSTGASTLHAIDSLASMLGLFGKEGCGVHYLGNSKLGFDNPFKTSCKRVSKATTDFCEFTTVLVQGGNPSESMPDSSRVSKELESVENLIYFGLYENETSKRAKIVIPAKNFFEKNDVRLSYSHHRVEKINKIVENSTAISEYEFTKYLFDAFSFDGLKSEENYINDWLEQCSEDEYGYLSPAYEALPYESGFGEDGEDEFVFIDDYDDDFINTKSFSKVRVSKKHQITDEHFWLLSPKSSNALNTQFKRDNKIVVNPSLGYKDGELLKVVSPIGTLELEVLNSEDIRANCVVIPNNTKGLNYLTPSILSNEGENACFQEIKVSLASIL